MEEFEVLLALLRPKTISLLKRDPAIDKIINEEILKHEMYVDDETLEIFLADISKKADLIVAKLAREIANSQKPIYIFSYITSSTKAVLDEILVYKEQIYNNSINLSCYIETAYLFLTEDKGREFYGSFLYQDLEEPFKKYLSDYFTRTIETAEKILNRCLNLSESISIAPISQKIKLNLSVGEIALLFRLLFGNKTVESDSKEELFRAINSSFESSKQDSISVNSLRKKYHDIDSKSLSDIDALLVNLRQLLKKMQ